MGFFVVGSQWHAAALGVTSITTALNSGSITAGNTDFDTATLQSFVPGGSGGTVTYTVFSDSSCSMNPQDGGTFNIDETTGVVPNSNTLSFGSAGTYYWQAVFSGDVINATATSDCSSETMVVGQASPTLTTVASPSAGTVGVNIGSLSDTATLSGGAAPSGSVNFTLYSDASCSTAVVITGSGTISGSTASYTTSWTPPSVGIYYWIASYAGDANNMGFTTTCGDNNEQVAVGKAAATITTQASPTTGTAGVAIAPAKDTATFAGTTSVAPTGSVTFTLYSNITCTTAVPGVSGSGTIGTSTGGVSTASFSVTWRPAAAGTYQWIASYAGDANNSGFTTTCGDSNEQIAVGTAAPALNTSLHASAITVGSTDFDTSLLTGYVTGGTGGTVTYTVYSDTGCSMNPRPAGIVSVNAATGAVPNSSTLSFNAAGTFYWQAVFSGDSNNTAASSACSSETLVVGKAAPTITTQASPTTGTAGVGITPAKDTATFAGTTSVAPTGSVTFALYSNSTCTAAVPGVSGSGTISTTAGVSMASFSVTWTPAAAGTYHWIASYAGDANNTGFTTTCGPSNEQVVVAKATATISTAANPTSGGTGSTLQDGATLAKTSNLLGTGSITFNLYGPGDTHCATVIHSETVRTIATNGPFNTAAGFVAKVVGTYHWTASFSGDGNNTAVSSSCTAEPVVIAQQMSQSTPSTTTCPQFASGFATGLSQIQYTLTGTKIGTVTPGSIAYWVKVASPGTYKITQTISETSRHLVLLSSSAVYDKYNSTTGSCASIGSSITQGATSGAVTVKFTTGAGPFYIGLSLSSATLVGEAGPKPSTTVHYVFNAGFIGSTSQIDLVFK